MGEPTGLIAKKGLELLTMGTPNGVKITTLTEELKDAYPGKFEVTYQAINIMKNTQKEPWFTAVNPNGRIPALIDHDRGDLSLFEGSALLSYLTRHYDPEHKFSFAPGTDDYDTAEAWIAWQHGGLGPMQGQANHFLRYAPEKIAYGIQRYVGETERLYGVLDARLRDRDYVAGPGRGKYSIADMAMLGWVNIAWWSGIRDLQGLFPHVAAWFDRCTSRPATARGMTIPTGPSGSSSSAMRKKYNEDPEVKKKEDEIFAILQNAKEKYNYKYASP